VIIGTAGHIDHGKTRLVAALTGIDTDRLPEEKRRGITIELGFAPLALDGVGTAGVVDVPGHEAFVRTMLAGASGIDLALLVIAADEGVMPQTREHLAILSLLGIRGGVVALSKRDLVDDEWLALVVEDVRDTMRGTPLGSAPIVPVSAATGAGLGELRDALAAAARSLPAREAADLFRLPVDRAFSVRGAGTVATGTVWSGSVRRDAVVRVLPGGREARVRGVQAFGSAADAALPGGRAAIALAGLEVADVPRGSTLVAADAPWAATRSLRADVVLLEDAPQAIRPRTRVRFHLGTADVGARVVTAGGALEPGGRKGARIVLDEPVVARAGDRFVLRTASPVATVGGGVVVDPLPTHRRARPLPAEARAPAETLGIFLEEAAHAGLERATLPIRLGVPPGMVDAVVAAAGARVLGPRVFAAGSAKGLAARVVALVDESHREQPLEPGASLQFVRSRLGAPAELAEAALRTAVEAGDLEVRGGLVMRRGWTPKPSDEERLILERLADRLHAAGREPPSVTELTAEVGRAAAPLLRLLERDGRLVQVEPDRYYDAGVLDALVGVVGAGMEAGREYGPAELRELLGVSRKYLIPLLEYCDRRGVTERRSNGRVLVGTQFA
jgi:selenocysteine-specific elongation factor